MDWIYSPTSLFVIGLLAADVTLGILLVGVARAKTRLGDWPGADRWYRIRLVVPLPATQLLFDRLHGQRPMLQHERLMTMALFGRARAAARYGGELARSTRTPSWLRVLGEAAAADELAERGELDAALALLDGLLERVPREQGGLLATLHLSRFFHAVSAGRFEEARLGAELVDRLLPNLGFGWPALRLVWLRGRDEASEALRLVRPILEGAAGLPELSDDELREAVGAAAVGPLHAAAAAHEAGWDELAARLLRDLRELPTLPPLRAPMASALEAAVAARRGERDAAASAIARADEEVRRLDSPPEVRSAVGCFVAEADRLLGRADEAVSRLKSLTPSARSPLSRWRLGRALGEAFEAAGRTGEAARAYAEALSTGVVTRLRPGLERRLAELRALESSEIH